MEFDERVRLVSIEEFNIVYVVGEFVNISSCIYKNTTLLQASVIIHLIIIKYQH